jgi:hypothetical protein
MRGIKLLGVDLINPSNFHLHILVLKKWVKRFGINNDDIY